MSKWIPWFILGIVSLFILLSYLYYARAFPYADEPSAPAGPVAEAFTEDPYEIRGDLRECTVYYTSNVDICNRDIIPSPTTADINNDLVNYYTLGKNTVNQQIIRLNAISPTTRTPTQTNALANLKRVLADIDTLPFKNTCKLEMTRLKESDAHPRKTNTDDDGANRRGNPLHWSFCYYNMANDSNASARIAPAVRAEPVFKRVFQDTTVDYAHPTTGGIYRRFDMKSMYNDDLLNLHCHLYGNSISEGGGAVSAFNNTRMMELTLRTSEVAALPANPTGATRLTITRMRPVRVFNGVLVVDTTPGLAKANALSLIEIVRTQTAFIHRQKAYNPTLYKLLFHLCEADPVVVKNIDLTNAIDRHYIQLVVPKPLNAPVSKILQFTPSFAATQTQIYDFYANEPQGDISDMTIDITKIDACIEKPPPCSY